MHDRLHAGVVVKRWYAQDDVRLCGTLGDEMAAAKRTEVPKFSWR